MFKLILHDRPEYWQHSEERFEDASSLINRIKAIPKEILDSSKPLAGISVDRDERNVMSIGLSSDGFILIHSQFDGEGELDQKLSVGQVRPGRIDINFGEWTEVPAWGLISQDLAIEVLSHWLETGESGSVVAFDCM